MKNYEKSFKSKIARRTTRIDNNSRLEKIRQSARECRARKKIKV